MKGVYRLMFICMLAISVAVGVAVGAKISDKLKNNSQPLLEEAKEKGYLKEASSCSNTNCNIQH